MHRPAALFSAVLLWAVHAAAVEPSVKGTVKTDGPPDGPVVVYIEKVPGRAVKVSEETVKVVQRGTAFVPSAAVVVKGQRLEFPNEDKIYHNVFSLTPGTEFDLGLYRGGVSKKIVVDKPGELDVYCNIHESMHARVLVLENDVFAVADKDGAYTLPELPPGHYRVGAWSSEHQTKVVDIDVKAGAPTRFDVTLAKREKASHLNKSGEQYGRYK